MKPRVKPAVHFVFQTAGLPLVYSRCEVPATHTTEREWCYSNEESGKMIGWKMTIAQYSGLM